MTTTIACPLTREPVTFTATAKLLRRAATSKDMDQWQVRLTSDYPGEMTLDYRTGTGLRKGGEPSEPEIRDVLICLSLDYITARDMPDDDAEAMDHLASEFGYDASTKPSELLRMARALRKNAEGIRALLKHTGIDADHFADWCAGLDQ